MLVTGAQGFVGSALAERLVAERARVVVPRRDSPARSRFRSEGIEERCDVVELSPPSVGSEIVGIEIHDRVTASVDELWS